MKTKPHPYMIACLTIMLLFISTSSQAEITIGLFLSKQTHILGESSPILSVTAQNSGPVEVQDVHIGVVSPNGTIYEFANWNTDLQPWLPAFTVPAGLQLSNTTITDLIGVPGGLTPGIWQAFFALTDPGTIQINQLKLVGLNVVDNTIGGSSGNGSKYGTVTINRTQSISGTTVSSAGVFYQADTAIPDLIGALQGQFPIIDQCVFNETQANPGDISNITVTSLDAGQISVTGSSDNIILDKQTTSEFFVYSATPSTPFFDNAGNFTFSGTGGPGVGTFNVSVATTNALDLISPALGSPLSINSGQNLDLTWVNNNLGAGEVIAVLAGADIDLSNPSATILYSITCRFIDDGQGSIPLNLLAQLQQALPADTGIQLPIDIPGGLPIDIPGLGNSVTLSINRTNYQFFTTSSPILNTGIATVSSGVFLTGSFQ